MKKFKHVILTRFNLGVYDREDADEWMSNRMWMFRATRLSVLSQEEEFEWVICVDYLTPKQYLRDIDIDDRITLTYLHPKDYFKQRYIEEPWVITTRLDNDDLYKPGAIKAIQDCFTEQEIIIDLKYEQYELNTGSYYDSDRPNPNGPFLSLVEKSYNIRTCYARPHNKMSEDWPTAIFASREILALMVIHDNNIGNKIVGGKLR